MASPRLVRIRARRRQKVAPRAVRWAKSPQTPRAVELTYVLALKRVSAQWRAKALSLLLPVLRRFAKKDDARTDAIEESGDYEAALGSAMDSLSSAGYSFADSPTFASAQVSTAKKTVAHSQREFKRLGIRLREAEPKLDKQIKAWRSLNTDLVKSMLDDQREILGDILTTGEGLSFEWLAKQVANRCDVTDSRAEFIARDQTLKLNSQITTSRMAAAGVLQFVWTTTGDERVRATHEELDGQTFDYDDPPVTNDDGDTNLPGEDYQCRCVPTPVLPEFDEADTDAEMPIAAE